jgi:DNA-directed RNA polymerase subunit alpha
MTASLSAPDAARLLDTLAFDAGQLADLKRAVHQSKETRQRVEQAAREAASASGAAASGERAGLRLAASLYLLSRPADALAALRSAGSSPQAVLLRGLCALEVADPASALSALASLVGTEMDGEAFFTQLATAAALAGDSTTAQKAAAKIPEGPNALYAEGIALESDGEYAEARRKYARALELDAYHPRVLFRLAMQHDKAGEDERAIELYRRCSNLQPPPLNALQNLALLYEDHGRFSEAEQCYRRILDAEPEHVRARLGIKDVQASQNQFFDEDQERREDRRVQILRTPISEFELSVRSRNCLAKMNIQTLGDLVRKTETELLAYKNFGETSLQEIKDILAQKGLRLGMRPVEDEAPLYTEAAATTDEQLDALFGGPIAGEAEDTDAVEDEYAEVPIEELDLSIRARRCMETLEIHTIGDLLQRSESELLGSKNFGQTSLNEIRQRLEAMGLHLKRR